MISLSASKYFEIENLLNFIQTSLKPEFRSIGNWMMIGGIPNVGKSTIINSLRKKEEDMKKSKWSGAKVGAVPCITKSFSGFKVMNNPLTYLVDSPGIIQPKILSNEDGLRLSICGSMRDSIIDPNTTLDYLLFMMNKRKAFKYLEEYKMQDPTDDVNELIM